MGRKPRSTLNLIKPNIADRLRRNQQKQKAGHDRGTVTRSFEIGTPVFARNFITWLPGKLILSKGNCAYDIELADGRIIRRHGEESKTPKLTKHLTYQLILITP